MTRRPLGCNGPCPKDRKPCAPDIPCAVSSKSRDIARRIDEIMREERDTRWHEEQIMQRPLRGLILRIVRAMAT